MSDKPFDKLNPIQQQIQRAIPAGMEDGVKMTIELIVGFELFSTRRYHNYETWSQGYRVFGPAGPVGKDWPEVPTVTVEREDLDDAVKAFLEERAKKVQELREANP